MSENYLPVRLAKKPSLIERNPMPKSKRDPILKANHSGSLATCKRLQRGRDYFLERLTCTGMDLIRDLQCASPRDLVRGLKANGMNIVWELDRVTESGARVSRWTLL